MAGSYELYTIIGNLGRDPELRYTQSGVAVVSFSVAISENWTDKSTGERMEKTKWVRVTAWKALAETCNKFLHKGSSVQCVGTVESSAYMKDDEPQASTDMTVRNIQFLDKHNASNDNYTSPPIAATQDDIPFDHDFMR